MQSLLFYEFKEKDMENTRETMYNIDGQRITEPYQKASEEFFKGDAPCWDLLKDADKDGFDIREDIVEVILPVGTKIIRFGFSSGSYTAPIGTDYEALSLPYKKESMPYHVYVVKASCSVKLCVVRKGIVASGFNSQGGAVQFKHPRTIMEELSLGILEEDFSWRKDT